MTGTDSKDERKARLAAALRANLHRRKIQKRTRRKGEDDKSSTRHDDPVGRRSG